MRIFPLNVFGKILKVFKMSWDNGTRENKNQQDDEKMEKLPENVECNVSVEVKSSLIDDIDVIETVTDKFEEDETYFTVTQIDRVDKGIEDKLYLEENVRCNVSVEVKRSLVDDILADESVTDKFEEVETYSTMTQTDKLKVDKEIVDKLCLEDNYEKDLRPYDSDDDELGSDIIDEEIEMLKGEPEDRYLMENGLDNNKDVQCATDLGCRREDTYQETLQEDLLQLSTNSQSDQRNYIMSLDIVSKNCLNYKATDKVSKSFPYHYNNVDSKSQSVDNEVNQAQNFIQAFGNLSHVKKGNSMMQPQDVLISLIKMTGSRIYLEAEQYRMLRHPFLKTGLNAFIGINVKTELTSPDIKLAMAKCSTETPETQISAGLTVSVHLVNDTPNIYYKPPSVHQVASVSSISAEAPCQKLVAYERSQEKCKPIGYLGNLVAGLAILEGLRLLFPVILSCLMTRNAPDLDKKVLATCIHFKDIVGKIQPVRKETQYKTQKFSSGMKVMVDQKEPRVTLEYKGGKKSMLGFEEFPLMLKYKGKRMMLKYNAEQNTRVRQNEQLYLKMETALNSKKVDFRLIMKTVGLYHDPWKGYQGIDYLQKPNYDYLFEIQRCDLLDDLVVNTLEYGCPDILISSQNVLEENVSENSNTGQQQDDVVCSETTGNQQVYWLDVPKMVVGDAKLSDIKSSDLFASGPKDATAQNKTTELNSWTDIDTSQLFGDGQDLRKVNLEQNFPEAFPKNTMVTQNLGDCLSEYVTLRLGKTESSQKWGDDPFASGLKIDPAQDKVIMSQSYTDVDTTQLFGDLQNLQNMKLKQNPKSTGAVPKTKQHTKMSVNLDSKYVLRPQCRNPKSSQKSRDEVAFNAHQRKFMTHDTSSSYNRAKNILRLKSFIRGKTSDEYLGIICGTEDELDRFLQSKIPNKGVIVNKDLQKVAACADSFPEDFDDYSLNKIKKIGIGYFRVRCTLGSGTYGTAYLCTAIVPGSSEPFVFVLKQILLSRFYPAEGLVPLHHSKCCPQILKIYGAYRDQDYMNILMEYAGGGTLHDVIRNNEWTTSDFITCLEHLLKGLQYLHSHDIVVYDLKVQNIVLKDADDPGSVAIIDWGSSKSKTQLRPLDYRNGTSIFLPPEFESLRSLQVFHDSLKAVDIWCVGCVLYKCLTGHTIWNKVTSEFCQIGDNRKLQMEKIRNHINKFKYMVYDEIAAISQAEYFLLPGLIHLLTGLLDPRAETRLTVEEALQHLVFSENRYRLIPLTVLLEADDYQCLSPTEMIRKLDLKTDKKNENCKVWVTLFHSEKIVAHVYVNKGVSFKDLNKETESQIEKFLPDANHTGYYFQMKSLQTWNIWEDCVVEIKKCE